MAVHLFNRYVWLLDLISQGGKTYEDIDRAWRNNYRLNHNKEPLPKRTLHNHISAIKDMFEIEIECRKQGGYKYVLKGSLDGTLTETQEALISHLRLSNALMGESPLKGRILFDKTFSYKYLNPLLNAMEQSKRVQIVHPRRVDEEHTVQDRLHLEPYFLKQYKEWFVIGRVVEENVIRIYSLNHIAYIVPTEEPFVIPKEFSATTFLDNIPPSEATPLDEREDFARYRADDKRYHRSRIGGFVPDEVIK